jgi:hypothetical protein
VQSRSRKTQSASRITLAAQYKSSAFLNKPIFADKIFDDCQTYFLITRRRSGG